MNRNHAFDPNRYKSCWLNLVPVFLVSFSAHAGVITVNGTNEVGSSSAIDSVGFNQSIPFTDFDFNYTFSDGDTYNISGQYAARYDSDGTWIDVTPVVMYTGSAPAAGTDRITFDLLQNYFDNSPGTWDGNYTETLPLVNSAGRGSTLSAQLIIDGQGLPVAGPFGPGSYYLQNTAYLSGLTGDILSWDYQFQFDFPATTTLRGARMARLESPVPEPCLMFPCGIALMLLTVASREVHRRFSVNSGKFDR